MKDVKIVNELQRRNYDAEKGFNLAAEKTENSVLTRYFKRNSQMHNRFGHELKEDIKRMGGHVETDSTIQGDLHRAWLSLKTDIASNSDEALLEECERGQKTAMKDYQSAVEQTVDTTLASKLASHKAQIVDVVHELKGLEITA